MGGRGPKPREGWVEEKGDGVKRGRVKECWGRKLTGLII